MLKSLAAAAALALAATGAQAATIHATSVDEYNEGAGIHDPARRITANALGAPDGKFLSLGLGGDATFSFGVNFGSPGAVFEITYGKRDGHVETADVFGILHGAETFLGAIINDTGISILTFSGYYEALKVVDTSPVVAGRDGFDIDSIRVTAVPLPAGGLLLAGALGGFAALRRRRR